MSIAPKVTAKIKKEPNKADKILKKMKRQIKQPRPSSVLVGLPKDAQNYPDGTSVLMVGATHEFGSDEANIPERSFLRSTLRENRQKYFQRMKKIAKDFAQGQDIKIGLNRLGAITVSDVQLKIIDIKEPPNAQATIDAKGSSNPLVDTSHLGGAITYTLKDYK